MLCNPSFSFALAAEAHPYFPLAGFADYEYVGSTALDQQNFILMISNHAGQPYLATC